MATNPKALDPAEAALDAIKEALDFGGLELPAEPAASEPQATAAAEPRAEPPELKLPTAPTLDAPKEADAAPTISVLPPKSVVRPSTPPANDDRRSVGQILQALQYRASRTPLILAAIASVGWIALVAYFAWTSRAEALSHTELAMLAIAAAGPAVFFFVTGALARRSEEMRNTAHAMTEVVSRLADPASMAAEHVVTLSQAIRREVASMGDGIERALARASDLETIVRSEVANLESSYADNERRIRALIDELSSEREAVTSNAERVRATIAVSQESLSRELIQAGERIAQEVSEAGGRVSNALGAKAEEIGLSLTRVGDHASVKLDDAIAAFDSALTARSEEIDHRLRAVGGSIAADIGVRGEHVVANIDAVGSRVADAVSSRGDHFAARLAETGDHVGETLTIRGGELNDLLANHAKNLSDAFEAHLGAQHEAAHASREQLTEAADRFSAMLEERAASFHEAARAAHEDFAATGEHLATAQDQINTTLAERAQAIQEALSASHRDLIESGDHVVAAISERAAVHRDALVAAHHEILEAGDRAVGDIGARAVEHRDAIHAVGLEFIETTDAAAAAIAARAAEHREVLAAAEMELADANQRAAQAHLERVEQARENLESTARAIAESGDHVAASLATHAMSAADLMRDSQAELTGHLKVHHEDLRSALEAQTEALRRLFADNASDAIEAIGVHGERVGQSVSESLRSFDETMVAHGGALADQISSNSDRFTSVVSEKLGAVEAAFTTHADTFTETLTARASEAAETMERQIADFERRASDSSMLATGALENLVVRLESSLETRANGLNESLTRNALATARALADGIQEINKGLGEGVRALNDTLDPSAIDERLGSRIAEINTAMETRLRDLAQTLATRTQDLHETLSGRAGDLHTLFDTKGPMLADLLSARGGDVAREIASIGEMVANTLESRGASIVENLGEKQAHLTQALDQSTHALNAAIESGAARSVEALVGTNDHVRAELTTVLEKLTNMSQSLQSLMGGTNHSLSVLESSLTDRVKEIHGAMGSMSSQVASLGQTANNAIAGAERLNAQISRNSADLSAAIADLSRTQGEFDQSLDHRRSSIEALLSSMSTKTEDFESAANTFAQLVDESFRKAEQRARDTGGFLVDSTREIAGLVERQFGDVREASGKERERTAAALRAAYEQASAEMNEIFGQAVERFRASAAEMRGMSADIQRELDATREEVRRGALELPQETAQQTAAMRRVVAEQIKALNDLTDIVARSGRVYDLAEPVSAPAVARSEPARLAEPPRQIATPAPAPRAPIPSPSAYEAQPRPRPPAAPQPAPRPVAPAPSAPPAGNGRGPGWITDLLARASREETEAPRPAARQPQSLDAISLDISRMVDPEAARDAWDAYYRGETGVFSRALYTSQGRATFEEIGRRYVTEPDLRESVDRYSQEFERILANVARDDRDGSRVRACLASDSGKVYTLLAHAAGRLD